MASGVVQSLVCSQSGELKNVLIDGAVINIILSVLGEPTGNWLCGKVNYALCQ